MMIFIRNVHFRSMVLWLVVVFCLQACDGEKLTAEESFNRAASGLAGVDNLVFKGSAVIRSDGNGMNEELVAYEGQLQDHKMLTITTTSPSSTRITGKISLEGKSQQLVSYKARELPHAYGQSEAEWLNPLEQLEFVGESDKKVTEESGAARGTKALRIELSSEASQELTKRALTGQMLTLRSRMDRKGDVLYTEDPKVRAKLQNVWEKENQELSRLLSKSNVKMVFHMTINQKSYLPQRLSVERTITLVDTSGKPRVETFVSDTKFLEYR